jgi:uncharacterized protein (TIGR02186 family)
MGGAVLRTGAIAAVVLALVLPVCSQNAPAPKPRIGAHLPKDEIQMSSSYHGMRLLLYGTVSPGCEVIVKLSSKRVPVTYARKGRVGGFWFTVGKVTFRNVPWMFKIRSTRPLDEILPPEEQVRYRVGRRGLEASIRSAPGTPPELLDDMIQTRMENQLYSFHQGGVARVKGNMFEASFYWPPRAPQGVYHIDSMAVKDGKVVAVDSELIHVQEVGIEAWVSELAQSHGLLYGLSAVAAAMLAGLIVGLVFRGMGPGRKRRPAVH